MRKGWNNFSNIVSNRWEWLTKGLTIVVFTFLCFSPVSAQNNNMVIEADKLVQDTAKKITTLTGTVKLYQNGKTIEADKVVHHESTGKMQATGNVRVIDEKGNILTSDEIEMDKNFKEGFLRAVNYETLDRTFMGAHYAKRQDGTTFTFEKTTYTACEPCKTDPKKTPIWQIRASKAIHREDEKRIYFYNSRLEILGVPILYMPYIFVPDHTAKRKSGFLSPTYLSSNKLGTGVEIPYYHVISDNHDVTFSPIFYSGQGFMPKVEWNYGNDNFKNTFRGAVINQRNPGAFNQNSGIFPYFEAPGTKATRYYANTVGTYKLTPLWTIGWDIHAFSDRLFMRDYNILAAGATELNSTLSLSAQGERSFFDLRAVNYQGVTIADRQTEIPSAVPQFDYYKSFGSQLLGGELSVKANSVFLKRDQADFDLKNNVNGCDSQTTFNNSRFDCLLRGLPGNYMRSSIDVSWRKRIYDRFGQVFEPFASLRGDIASYSLRQDNDVAAYLGTSWAQSNTLARFMPTLGITYRYPFVNLNSAGTFTVEPVAQLIARPNESNIGRLPNEDAQSLVFDDSTLFATNKFSGWDRIEGGGRLNYGVNMTARLNNGVYFNALFGQSRHLFGVNSYNYGAPIDGTSAYDMAGTGANSGLDKNRSDYVARFQLRPMNNIMLSARFRFEESTWRIMRTEVDASVLYKRLSLIASYADYQERPLLGFLSARKGVGGAMSYKVNNDLSTYVALRYDLDENRPDSMSLGINYLDDCFNIGFFYSRVFYYTPVGGTTKPPDDHRFLFRVSLRTVGDQRFSRSTLN